MIIKKNGENNVEYLTNQESDLIMSNPYNIPVIEQHGIIELDKILEFCDYNDYYEYEDCIQSIMESNNINNFCIAINEEDIILQPDIVNLFENYVIIPINENSKIYQECIDYTNKLISLEEARKHTEPRHKTHKIIKRAMNVANLYGNRDTAETMNVAQSVFPYSTSDMAYNIRNKMYYLTDVNDPKRRKRQRYQKLLDKLDKADRNRQFAITGGVLGAGVLSATAIYKLATKKKSPKSFIGKKIASFRKIYSNLLKQAQKNPKKAGMLKRVAAKILKVIDQLMSKLQTMAG